jgi:tetratricopeptide (TPR) repeat protein/precorrin-6B methylase 2
MSLLRKILSDPIGARNRTQSVDDHRATDDERGERSIASVDRPMEQASILSSITELSKSGLFGQALGQVDRALAATPNDPELLLARSFILFAWGRFREARDAAMQAEAMGLRESKLYVQLGWSCYSIGSIQEAEASMRKAITAEPQGREAFIGLATVLHAQGRLREAIAAFKVTLGLCPDDAECLVNIGVCELEQGEFIAAEASLDRATAQNADNANAWSNLGIALGQLDRHDDATKALRRAERLDAKNVDGVDAYVNLAKSLEDANLSQEALDVLETNLGDKPNPAAQIVYAHQLLRLGRLREGWEAYEFRWLNEPLRSKRFVSSRPMWNGQDLRGKTILLRAEQGLGDTIQFARYAPRVKALGATVLLMALPGTEALLAECPGLDRILSPGASLPDFDYYINLLSLPRIFGTELDSIPAERAYLRADGERAARWRSRVGDDVATLNVGLVWRGDPNHGRDRYRSIPLQEFAPLASVEGVRIFSLQKEAKPGESTSPNLQFTDLAPELADLCDTAALISQLHLLICVDTAVAHLAGGLGVEVWLLLPVPSDWRWLEQTEKSPWYPSMRIFRQSEHQNWNEVIVRVAAALRDRVAAVPLKRASRVASKNESPVVATLATPSNGFAQISASRRFTKVTETRYGIVQYLPDQPIIGDSVRHYGELHQPQLDLLARIIPHGGTGLEVGAGVGSHALFFANAIGDSGHLYLFEPQQKMQRILRQNLRANRVANVTLLRSAAGEGLGLVDALSLPRLDLLKINSDIDAIEVIEGAKETLWRLRPVVFAAVGDDQVGHEVARRVRDCGYRCWRNETALFNPENFARCTTDVFAGGTALAILGVPEEIDMSMALDGCTEL